jgi:hypothetical protein
MPERTQFGKWVLYERTTGTRLERWPVDARGMLESGDYADAPVTGAVAAPAAAAVDAETPPPAVGGYRVEKAGSWWKAFGPDGAQIGAAQRKAEDARALIPVTHQGPNPVPAAEHSPGVPLRTGG